MIGLVFSLLGRILVHGLPTLLGCGTLMGTDKKMKFADHKEVKPWVLVSMNALQRTQFIDAAVELMNVDDHREREIRFMHFQMQIIAVCARNRLGYFLFNPLNPKHLNKLSQYPEPLLRKAFETACALSGLEYLVPKDIVTSDPEVKTEPEQKPAYDQEDDGLDWPEDDEEANPNP